MIDFKKFFIYYITMVINILGFSFLYKHGLWKLDIWYAYISFFGVILTGFNSVMMLAFILLTHIKFTFNHANSMINNSTFHAGVDLK